MSKGKRLVDDILGGLSTDSLKKDLLEESSKIGDDISKKKLSDNELILRMSVVKSICSLRTGKQISMEKVLQESQEMLSWVKSL